MVHEMEVRKHGVGRIMSEFKRVHMVTLGFGFGRWRVRTERARMEDVVHEAKVGLALGHALRTAKRGTLRSVVSAWRSDCYEHSKSVVTDYSQTRALRSVLSKATMRMTTRRKDMLRHWRHDVDRQDSELLRGMTAKSPYMGTLPPRQYRKTLKSSQMKDRNARARLSTVATRLLGLAQVKAKVPKLSLKRWIANLANAREQT
jgi:hypothetical protein